MSSEYKQYPIINGLYYHYKGGLYRVIRMLRHDETGEDLVYCKSIHWGSYHLKPLKTFFEQVTDHNNQKTERFLYKGMYESNRNKGS